MIITPEQIAKPGTEHAHQSALFQQMALYYHLWPELRWAFAIPNGGERNIIVAGRLKAEGVKSGVSDVCIPVARGPYHGFFIEMKKPSVRPVRADSKGAASDKQLEFGEFVTTQGYKFVVCYDWIDAWSEIVDYLSLE